LLRMAFNDLFTETQRICKYIFKISDNNTDRQQFEDVCIF
jgi:hypothetical protein